MKTLYDKFKSPWACVPTLYFAEGLPYILVNSIALIFYKRMGIPNDSLAFWTSVIFLPWALKMLWSPLVEIYSTKRRWILLTQALMAAALFAAALACGLPAFFALSLAAFALAAFVSATQDIAVDGFYMLALDQKQQALFVGIRVMFYRLAMLFGSGALVYFAGSLEEKLGSVAAAWAAMFGLSGLLFALLAGYHAALLPRPDADARGDAQSALSAFKKAWAASKTIFGEYIRQKDILYILLFIVLYRFAETMLGKMSAPFVLDSLENGGLAVTTKQVGLLYGTVGLAALTAGGIFGGWLIARYGFRKCIWPMALAMNVPDLVYVYMAYAKPAFAWLFPLVAVEQLGYGIGAMAYTVYLMNIAQGPNKTAHFAISTSLMALGVMLPGMISGKIQMALGYGPFFILVCLMTIPSFLVIPLILKTRGAEN
ncbi:MAG: AmpG family muropeptide MFS transporter [Elusimicrobia bacterium]|nr:AmpG family muropeptide MFS transporter [Elusimicrobiota bacterium]